MEISEKQKELIIGIAKKYGLKMVLLFGSQVLGQTHAESDVDVAFLPAGKISGEDDYIINYEFTNIFKTDKVDTVNLRYAPPLLMKQIIDNCRALYEAEPMVFYNFEVYALQRYGEMAPLFAIRDRRIKEFVHG